MRRWPVVVAGVLVLLALVGVGYLLLSTGNGKSNGGSTATSSPSARATTSSPTPSATPTRDPQALAQLRALSALLDQTSAARGAVASTVTALQACTVPGAQAQTTFQQAAAGRRSAVDDLGRLELTRVTDGEAMHTALREALTSSADADDAFAAWAGRTAAACTPGAPDPDLARGIDLSGVRAQPAKQQFVALYDPQARAYGLASRSASEI